MTICTDLPSAIFIKGQIFVAKSSEKQKIDITIDFSIKNYARWKSPQLLTRFIDGVMNFFYVSAYIHSPATTNSACVAKPHNDARATARAPNKQTRISPQFSGEIRREKFPLDQFFALFPMVATIPTDSHFK